METKRFNGVLNHVEYNSPHVEMKPNINEKVSLKLALKHILSESSLRLEMKMMPSAIEAVK